ncbi:MAG: flagellar basal body rod protein FlgB, partial [Rhodospirillales bacterium]
MELEKMTLFAVVKKRLAWLSQRQEVIAQNIANADTPNYKSRDLKPFQFKELLRRESSGLNMSATQASHLRGVRTAVRSFQVKDDRKPYETNPTGNSVVLEEQMAKMNEN